MVHHKISKEVRIGNLNFALETDGPDRRVRFHCHYPCTVELQSDSYALKKVEVGHKLHNQGLIKFSQNIS